MIERRAFLLTSAAFLALPGCGAAQTPPAGSKLKARTLQAAGARAPIEILEDALGIPHIRAKSKHDAFFGQGYVVARDRLFQVDLSHRRDLGRMAEALGARFVPFDRAARLFLFHGDIDAELKSLPPEVLDCARGYCAGINAWIAAAEADPSLLPPEYAILSLTPLRWDVRDLVRVRNSGMGNVDDEVRRAQLQARGLLEFDQLMDPLRPAWAFKVPEGLDCGAVTEADLGILAEAAKPLPWTDRALAQYEPLLDKIDRAAQGSNAWTIAGSRTTTGRPILANDPHLGIGGFSPRHISHLTAPGLDVIGGASPGLPGIMQGHTDRFAFGRTNFHIDQTDLFILRTKDDDPERYWHKGAWTVFETVEEEIAVKGAAPVRVTLRYSKGRPVVSQDPARQRATAFATVSLLPGANMNFSMIAINLAQDWTSLREAFKLHVSPTNIHYADIDGNTGWHAVGFTPRRPKHDGLLPAPGDGSFDWTGILKVEEMPNIYNPKEGWFASANQMNLPADYPYKERIIDFSWSDPYRYNRIAQVLGEARKHSIADSIALQHDITSLPAQALVALIPQTLSPDAAKAAAMLRDWNFRVEADSAPALLYELVMPELSEAFRDLIIPPAAKDLIKSVNLSEMLRVLGAPDKRLGTNPAAARDALVDKALAAGWAKAVKLRGADPAKWRWGDLHQVIIAHPLGTTIPEIGKIFPKIEGGRSGGDGTTPMARGLNAARGTYQVNHGASFQIVADVGAWDNSQILLLPGQSADPRSAHYQDFYPLWLEGKTQPLLFSRAAVDKAATGRIILAPPG